MAYSILLVDDTVLLAEVIADTLRMEGFIVQVAFNGMEALEVLERERHDLIISDLRMPVMGGIELIKQVRSRSELTDIPIIVLSAQADEASKYESTHAGADLFLAKPFDERELLSLINHFLN